MAESKRQKKPGALEERLIELKRKIRSKLRLEYIRPEEIPEIELYMDQVTRYMEQQLGANRRNEEDKVLTRTMINNYTRNHLMSAPDRKRYSRAHIVQLIYIYYLKNVLAINDIRKILEPLQEQKPLDQRMMEIYQDIYELEKPQYFNIEASTVKAASLVDKKFSPEKDPYLNKMAFIYLLAYDMFSKKRLIEKLIDEMDEEKREEKEALKQALAKAGKKQAMKKPAAGVQAAKKPAARVQAAKKPAAGVQAAKKPAARTAAAGKKPIAKKKEQNQ